MSADPALLADPPDGMINAYGSLLKLDPGDALFLGSHDYEPYETKLAIGLVRPGDIAVDVGAMIGYYTMLFSRGVGPEGRVYSFEPDPDSYALLSENLELNNYTQTTARQAIVGKEAGRSQLFRAPDEFRGDNRAYATEGRDAVDVEVVKLDDVIDEPVDIVKIDVQGYEGHVLAGMHDLIERSKDLTMLVEFSATLLHEAGTDPRGFLSDLQGFGFALYKIDEDAKCVRHSDGDTLVAELTDAASGAYTLEYTNLLCVKKRADGRHTPARRPGTG